MSEKKKVVEKKIESREYTAIIFGATGACGKFVLKSLLESKSCTKILAVSRRKLDVESKKLSVIIWKEFNDYLLYKSKKISEVEKLLSGFTVCFSCLGVPKGLSKNFDDYVNVNETYPIVLAQVCKKVGVDYHYLISSVGANKDSWFQYPKMKGKSESDIEKLKFKGYGIVRPSFLLANRGEKTTFGEKAAEYLVPVISFFGASDASIDVKMVGKGMINHWEKNWNEKKNFGSVIITTRMLKEESGMEKK